MLRSIILLVAMFLLHIPAKSRAQEITAQYKLRCQFEGLPDHSTVYLITQKKDTIQTTISKGNQFTFEGVLPSNGQFLFVGFDPQITRMPSKAIFVVNQPMEVRGTIGKREITVKGSPAHEDYVVFLKMEKAYNFGVNKLMNDFQIYLNTIQLDSVGKSNDPQINARIDSFRLAQTSAINTGNDIKMKWIADHISSLIAPYFMVSMLSRDRIATIRTLFGKTSKDIQTSYYGKQLDKNLQYADIYILFEDGAIFPNLQVADEQGNSKGILDLVKGSKLTLIDCWASWCAPCRAGIPNLKLVYEMYKDKGLKIIGISTDKDVKKWRKAIKDDKTEWDHFIELQGSSFSKMCSIEAIPAYILLDESGKMLAFDCAFSEVNPFGGSLQGVDLAATIEKHLKAKIP